MINNTAAIATDSKQVFPKAVIAGNLIFVSGTTGVDPTTGILSERFD